MEQLIEFIGNHALLSAAFVFVFTLLLINEWLETRKKPESLSPQQLVQSINHDHPVIVDLREKALFQKSHIIHAIHASASDFEHPKMHKYKSKPLILVCAQGQQSIPLAAKLRAQGYTHALVLQGGMKAWLSAELPVVKDH